MLDVTFLLPEATSSYIYDVTTRMFDKIWIVWQIVIVQSLDRVDR